MLAENPPRRSVADSKPESRGRTSSRAASGGSPPPTATFAAAATGMSRTCGVDRLESRSPGRHTACTKSSHAIDLVPRLAGGNGDCTREPGPEPDGPANQPDPPSGTLAPIAPAQATTPASPPIAPARLAPAPIAPIAPFAPPGLVPVPCPQPPSSESDTLEVLPHYGWQIALADAAALTIALSAKSGELSAGIYLLDGAVIHSAHNQPGRAVASVLLRVGLPFAGAFILGNTMNNGDDIPVGILLGFGVGLITASVVDATLIAGPVTVRKKPVTWTPKLSATHDKITLGIAGGF